MHAEPERSRLIILLSGAALLLPSSIGLLTAGAPTFYCPRPFVTVMPAFLFGSMWRVSIVVPTLFFFAWNPGFFQEKRVVPKRTVALFGSLVGLSVVWFVIGWNFGLQYQGPSYTWTMLAVNVLWIAVLTLLLLHSLKRESFTWNLAIHWLLFAWLAWCAFPYLGELP